ncbi:MAG: aspartate/glutamate racemase family protein [Rhodobacteraceae bacterium]|nr:aspartate/glutamate racemase family protein [Paracoccaceae bacterium]
MRTVGILGGMGPEATVLLMQRLLQAVKARDDADHIPLIVHQNPAVPSRIKRLVEGVGEDPGPVLAAMARDLQAAGAEALAMPCNTAHAYAPQIIAATPLPFLDMRAATVAALPKGRVAMLASPAVRITGAFDAHFAAAGITPVWPEDEAPVLALIRRVKTGDTGPEAHQAMAALAEAAEGPLLVACTELSLLTGALRGPFTDSLDCLVGAIRKYAQG